MNRKLLYVVGILLNLVVGILLGAGGLWLLIESNMELRFYLLERPLADQPQAQVAAFTHAVARGDRAAALELWDIEGNAADSVLGDRREQVMSDLLAARVNDYMITGVEWWSTCCEPSVTCHILDAGGARLRIQFLDEQHNVYLYMVDVFTREQPYWGAAAGYPPRDWVIRDIYAHGQVPLFWRLLYSPQIRHVAP